MSDTDMLDRLMAALNRNPRLLFQVWSSLRQIGFYGPWKREGPDYVVEDMDGNIVGSIQEEAQFEWEAGAHSGTCSNLAEAQQQVETALAGEGWRRVPDEISSKGEVKLESKVTSWVENTAVAVYGPSGFWERVDKRSGRTVARVYHENRMWKGVVFKPDSAPIRYECSSYTQLNTCEFAKHATDVLLHENGLLPFAEITPEPR